MSTLLGANVKPGPEQLAQMRRVAKPEDRWACYQNQDLGHYDLGRCTYLVTGPTRTYTTPPAHAPDNESHGLGWRYLFVGFVDLDSGTIVEV